MDIEKISTILRVLTPCLILLLAAWYYIDHKIETLYEKNKDRIRMIYKDLEDHFKKILDLETQMINLRNEMEAMHEVDKLDNKLKIRPNTQDYKF